jgi:hypothetical protein
MFWASETITFSINVAEPFPTTWVAVTAAATTVVSIGGISLAACYIKRRRANQKTQE